ncbi:MAG: O-antigen ligase family protein [Gemmatimonadaceae bacterium]|nr:O-antigen ligase family protein [Gemmatimonadaceae bacterium]
MTLTLGGLPPRTAVVDQLLLLFMSGGAGLAVAALGFGQVTYGRLEIPNSMDPNDLGAVMAMTAPLALGYMLRARALGRVSGALVLALTAWVLIKTDSRGGSIGIASACAIVVLFSIGKKRLLGMAFLAAAAVLLVSTAPASYFERLATLKSVSEDYNQTSYYGRVEVWRRGLGYVRAHPIVGVGAGAFEVAEGVTLEQAGKKGKWSNAHNAYLQAFAELGLPGGLLFLSLVVASIASSFRLVNLSIPTERKPFQRPELLGAVVGLAVSSFFLSFAYFAAWFGLWGLCVLGYRTMQSSSAPALTQPLRN